MPNPDVRPLVADDDGPLRFIGYARFALAPDQRVGYAALFAGCGNGNGVSDFQNNEEIAAVHWWDLRETLPGRVQPLDTYLAELAR
jgi:hypothetical protein